MWSTEAENDFLRIKSNSKAPFPSLIELSSVLEKKRRREVWHQNCMARRKQSNKREKRRGISFVNDFCNTAFLFSCVSEFLQTFAIHNVRLLHTYVLSIRFYPIRQDAGKVVQCTWDGMCPQFRFLLVVGYTSIVTYWSGLRGTNPYTEWFRNRVWGEGWANQTVQWRGERKAGVRFLTAM